MNIKLLLPLFFIISTTGLSQEVVSTIRNEVSQEEIETHVRFLASDELMGREAGTRGIDVAAAYISAYFKALGIQPLPGMDSYYQPVPFYKTNLPKEGEIKIGQISATVGNEFFSEYKGSANVGGEAVYANFGTVEDIKKKKIKDKIVVVKAGEENAGARAALSPSAVKAKINRLEDAGAKAVIMLWHYAEVPWDQLKHYMNNEELSRQKPEEDTTIPVFLMNAEENLMDQLQSKEKMDASISYSGRVVEEVESYNVLGYIEGSDPEMKDDYLMLSAHYDHVGGQESSTGEDLIYNGARDNAVGTAAVMMAGDYFSDFKPKHSIILALWTAEEKGLLGSKYFVENTPVELENIIYNLNIDNAGYNDTTKVTVIGLDRTLAEEAIKEAVQTFNLEAITDPAPEQNLFDRSDNVNFAQKGIPSPTYSLGFTAFDEEIFKYYHQVTDEAESVNFNYITKYTRGYILAAYKIANALTDIFWVEGDKYEAAGKELYQNK